MKKILMFLFIVPLVFVLISCDGYLDNNALDVEDHYSYYTTVYQQEDEGFILNGHKYNRISLQNYEYLIYNDELADPDDFALCVRNSNGGTYPKLLKMDVEKIMFFQYSYLGSWEYDSPFDTYTTLWIKEGCEMPLDTALITNVELKINKQEQKEIAFDSKLFDNLFRKCDNVEYIWNLQEDEKTYVDVYIGYAYISFYSEGYDSNFKIVTKVYQDQKDNYFIKCDDWYQLMFDINNG